MRRNVPQRPFVQRNRGAILGFASLAVVVAALAILVLRGGGDSKPTTSVPASAALVDAVTKLPSSVLDTVGAGSSRNGLKPVSAPPLTADGKPLVLYVGGEFCPFCAAERWPMVIALSRFGSFDGLKLTASSPTDVYPNTASFSFDGATYTSPYLTFQGVEQFSNRRAGNGYEPLQSLTSEQQQIVATYNPNGGIPFVDFGGKYVLSGATYDPSTLSGLDAQAIAALLPQTSTSQAQGIDGSANLLTAAICKTTNGQPGEVCQAPGVVKAAAALGQ
jgi:hypothetical protein